VKVGCRNNAGSLGFGPSLKLDDLPAKAGRLSRQGITLRPKRFAAD
jgi:hypothetical protein